MITNDYLSNLILHKISRTYNFEGSYVERFHHQKPTPRHLAHNNYSQYFSHILPKVEVYCRISRDLVPEVSININIPDNLSTSSTQTTIKSLEHITLKVPTSRDFIIKNTTPAISRTRLAHKSAFKSYRR